MFTSVPCSIWTTTPSRFQEDNSLNKFFRKRKSFEAERELRACFIELVDGVGWSERALIVNPPGHYVSCDIPTLVDRVFVSPTAPQWYAEAVSEVIAKFGLEFPISKSSISELRDFLGATFNTKDASFGRACVRWRRILGAWPRSLVMDELFRAACDNFPHAVLAPPALNHDAVLQAAMPAMASLM